MCGIVGYIGHKDAKEILLKGLEKLEYRGYDSAGIALKNGDGVTAGLPIFVKWWMQEPWLKPESGIPVGLHMVCQAMTMLTRIKALQVA